MAQAGARSIIRRPQVAAAIAPVASPDPSDSARDRLARNVRMLRATHRLSQHALAFDAGLTPAIVSGIETRKANPTMTSLDRIARALRVDLSALFADRPSNFRNE